MVKLDKKEITSLIQKVLDNNLSLLKMFVYESISYTCSDNEITIEYGYFGKISMYKTTITIKVLDNSTTVEYTCYGDCIKEEIKKDDNENYYSYIEKILDCIYSVIKKIRDKIINMEKELAKKIVLENIEELGLVADDVKIDLSLESPQFKPTAEVIIHLKRKDYDNAIRIYGKICEDLFIINEIEVKCEDEMYNDLVFSGLIEKIVEYINSIKSSK